MIKADILSLAYGASGVARPGGKVCFVKGALPGEEVSIRILKETAKYSEGEIVDLLKPSPHRVAPVCPYYGRCGGCQLQHISYERELFHKQSQVAELFDRIAGIDVKGIAEEIEASSSDYGYRTGITVHKGKKSYGYYSEGTHDIVEIEKCPLAVDPINLSFNKVTSDDDRREITIRADHAGGVWTSNRTGHRFYIDRYGDTDLYLSTRSFSQCNRHISCRVAEKIHQWIGDRSEGACFFDVFCGSGFFSFLVKGGFSLKIGIDENRISIDCAKNTLKRLGSGNMRFYRGSAEKVLPGIFERTRGKFNILLLDPPRKGADKKFLENIRNNDHIDLLYYISCDPACMARDSRILTLDGKWTINRIKAFDMFPRTRHIEVLAEFTRNS